MVKIDESNYFLETASTSFNERQKNVFGELDKVEPERPNRFTEEELNYSKAGVSRTVSSTRKEMKQFRGQESIFKRPDIPIPGQWKRKMPDFKKNPHKWTKYSLEDISTDQMSDQSNKAAAMSFLKEMSVRSESDPDSNEGAGQVPQKIVFNRHVRELNQKDLKEDEKEKPVFIGGKLTMPEYVVGQKIKPKKSVKKVPVECTSNIKLDHLLEEDDENE